MRGPRASGGMVPVEGRQEVWRSLGWAELVVPSVAPIGANC